eukprot:gene9423-17139_t
MATSSELEEFKIGDETVEVVSFIYLGAKIERGGGCTTEIIRLIGMGKAAMTGRSLTFVPKGDIIQLKDDERLDMDAYLKDFYLHKDLQNYDKNSP